ncbi:MAG: sulfatase, partial [Verrucomicrobiota bacterium]
MHPFQQHCLDVTRRHFLRHCGVGLGKIALASLLTEGLAGRVRAATTPSAGLPPRQPHFSPRAKRVIHLFMAGAPSQL